jgi:hypothetical protein
MIKETAEEWNVNNVTKFPHKIYHLLNISAPAEHTGNFSIVTYYRALNPGTSRWEKVRVETSFFITLHHVKVQSLHTWCDLWHQTWCAKCKDSNWLHVREEKKHWIDNRFSVIMIQNMSKNVGLVYRVLSSGHSINERLLINGLFCLNQFKIAYNI